MRERTEKVRGGYGTGWGYGGGGDVREGRAMREEMCGR